MTLAPFIDWWRIGDTSRYGHRKRPSRAANLGIGWIDGHSFLCWAQVTLASSNSYSYGRKEMRFDEYLASISHGDNRIGARRANETYYLFGDLDNREFAQLIDAYHVPSHAPTKATGGHEYQLSFGVGGHLSGVMFHFHGPGFIEVVHGQKVWFIYRDGRMPQFDANMTSAEWYTHVYPTLPVDDRPDRCTIGPGEVLYFPSKWYHATLNIGFTVFMTTFL